MQNRRTTTQKDRVLWSLLTIVVCYALAGATAEEYGSGDEYNSTDDYPDYYPYDYPDNYDYPDYGYGTVNGTTDYVVLSKNMDSIVLLLRIYWNEQWYYVCEDSLTLNAVKAFCRSFFYVDGGFYPGGSNDYFPLLSVDISCNGYENDFSKCNITERANSSSCPSNTTRSFYCSRQYMPFLDLELPNQVLYGSVDVLHSEGEGEVMSITLPNMRIGPREVQTAYVYRRGLISFDQPVDDPATVQIDDSDRLLLFPFRWNTEAVASNYTTVRAVVHNCTGNFCLTSQMRVAWLYFYFGTDFEFRTPNYLVMIEWRNLTFPCCPDQSVDFQVVLIGERLSTYTIYTYFCPSDTSPYDAGFIPHPISATVGVSIEDLFDREFRYSNTDYTVEMRCMNRIAGNRVDYNWYNLYYDLTDRSTLEMDSNMNAGSERPFMSTENNENMLLVERGSCVDKLMETQCSQTSCCQVFTDPSTNCEVVARQGSCFCDGLCFERGDCCDDIDAIPVLSCVPLCQEDQVNTIAGRYYPDGPVFACKDGFPHFTDQVQWNESLIQNTAVTCSNLQEDINLQDDQEEGSSDGSGMLSLTLPRMPLYPVQFYFSCETGFEDSLGDCKLPYGDMRKLTYEEIATVPCSADIPYCDDQEGIRLVHPDMMNSSRGIVQVCHYGVWIPVCGQGWSDEEASLACEQLGFVGTLVNTTTVSIPAGINQLILDSFPIVKCVGGPYSSLQNCIVSDQQCSVLTVAFVDCDYVPPPTSPPTTTPSHEATPTVSPPTEPLSVGALSAVIVVPVLAILCVFAVIFLGGYYIKKNRKKKLIMLRSEAQLQSEYSRYIGLNKINFAASLHDPKNVVVADPELLKQLTDNLIITNIQLRLLDSIGQGEFGLVYKGHWFPDGSAMPTAVAIKTLKGAYSAEDVNEFLRESIRLQQFNHPNVMGLLGVCLDAGPTPYIVLPFMSGGSLLSYIKKQRSTLVVSEEAADEDDIEETRKLLMSMCHQVAKGMAYLAEQKFIHRDLAARNCMIDHEGVIKVADFGLSKNTYEKMYFRQDKSEGVKLPVKWMALESMEDAVFSEKTDVWSFGVTCWEIFSGGKVPYPGISPMSLPSLIEEGHRMDKPHNAACSDEIFDMIMLRCWWKDPDDRPTFSELESDLSNYLTSVAGYLDFNEFALDVSPDSADPVPNHEDSNHLSLVTDEEEAHVKKVEHEVMSPDLTDSLL